MGRPWDADLPVVNVPWGTAKHVTIIMPYYDNPVFLNKQIAGWLRYPTHVFQQLSMIIVDDCSPRFTLEDRLRGIALPQNQIRAFRLEVDVRWNWLAARNIGAHHAQDGWLLLTDMDHVVPAKTAAAVVFGQHDPGTIYGFSRREHTGEQLRAHPNSWLMTREMFWHIGGYDETLSGHYGTDGDWRRRMVGVAPLHILSEHLERHEYVDDSSTTSYLRKQPEDAAVKRLISQRRKGWKPKTLTFPYHEISLQGVPCLAR